MADIGDVTFSHYSSL